LNSQHPGSPNMHHAIGSSTQLSRLTRIFSTTLIFTLLLLQYSDPSDLVLIFDTTFGTNIYGMSLGFFVSPDKHGGTQVIALTLLQHKDQASINWVSIQLRLPMNGGVDGNVVTKIIMTDGCGKLMRDILEELIIQPDSDSTGRWIMRQIFTIHLLCLCVTEDYTR